MRRSVAVVRYQQEGWHRWPTPTPNRLYLADRHRHLFHVEVQLEVRHEAREIEFHDLLDVARAAFPSAEDMAIQSCETIARWIHDKIVSPESGRWCQVSVFEDGEVGAIFTSDGTWP